MNRPLSHPLTWSDTQLREAIRASTNWVGVMRMLDYGDRSKSAGAIRIVRRRAAELGIDSSHFRGKRRWTDPQLRQAVSEARTWEEVLTRLGLSTRSGNIQPHIKSHTIRLGLDTSHLSRPSHLGPGPAEAPPETTTTSTKDGWTATVGHHPDTHARSGLGHRLVAYDPEFIDLFFVIDGDLMMYLIPSRAVAGRVRVLLRTYKKYIVGNAAGMLGTGVDAVRPTAVGRSAVARASA
jgi:hypothetical protein